MWHDFWLAFWFFLPAGLANMAPVLASKLPVISRWKTPLDGAKKFRGHRVLGDNKTWRGLCSGAVLAAALGWPIFAWLGLSLDRGNYLLLGAAMGIGALLGDAVESFFKRQFQVAPGDSWFPFDQIDYIIGGLLASLLFVRLPWNIYILVTVLYFGLHLTVSYIGFLLHFKDKPI